MQCDCFYSFMAGLSFGVIVGAVCVSLFLPRGPRRRH